VRSTPTTSKTRTVSPTTTAAATRPRWSPSTRCRSARKSMVLRTSTTFRAPPRPNCRAATTRPASVLASATSS